MTSTLNVVSMINVSIARLALEPGPAPKLVAYPDWRLLMSGDLVKLRFCWSGIKGMDKYCECVTKVNR